MGATSIYLLPTEEIDPQLFATKAKQVLLHMKVIEDENYGSPDWWVAGPSSRGILVDPVRDGIGFEYCVIRASDHLDLVPQDPAEFPECPGCGEDVSEAYYDVVNDAYERFEDDPAAREQALVAARVACERCSRASPLTDLKAAVGILLARTWINFDDTAGPMKQAWLEEFNEACGWSHECLEYWYT